jgi:hypothetical protein
VLAISQGGRHHVLQCIPFSASLSVAPNAPGGAGLMSAPTNSHKPVRDDRKNTRMFGIHWHRSIHSALRELAAQEDTTAAAIMSSALAREFTMRGMPVPKELERDLADYKEFRRRRHRSAFNHGSSS